ncbi:MAG TPA: stage III sporulation protein AE [Candidatus Pelethocola excrementipullorum]|nr:stage III sporulation protein AE [Candidatus Pelethocola excrementipullorum]
MTLTVVILLFAGGLTARAEGETEVDVEDSLLDSMNLDSVQDAVDELLGDTSISFGDAIKELIKGDQPFSGENMKNMVQALLEAAWGTQKTIWINILILVLAAALFSSFSGVFSNGQLGEMSFYLVYLLVFALLVKNLATLSGELKSTLEGIVTFMQALTPAYFLAVATATGASTAAMFYQIILLVILLVERVLIYLVLPGIHVFVLLSFVNHLYKEDLMSKMTELLKSVICWTMNTMLGLIVGLQVTRSLISPALDSLKRTAIGKTAGAIPGVGNAINAVTEMVIGSAVLVRNCLGVAAVVILFLCALQPVLHIVITGLSYRFLAAFAQPVSDKRMVGALNSMGEGCGLLLKVLFTTEVLFLLTIAILAGTVSGA